MEGAVSLSSSILFQPLALLQRKHPSQLPVAMWCHLHLQEKVLHEHLQLARRSTTGIGSPSAKLTQRHSSSEQFKLSLSLCIVGVSPAFCNANLSLFLCNAGLPQFSAFWCSLWLSTARHFSCQCSVRITGSQLAMDQRDMAVQVCLPNLSLANLGDRMVGDCIFFSPSALPPSNRKSRGVDWCSLDQRWGQI